MPESQPEEGEESESDLPDSRLDDTSPWVSYLGLSLLVVATLPATVIAFFSTCTVGSLIGLVLRLEERGLVALALLPATLAAGVVLWFAHRRWVGPLWRRLKRQNQRFGRSE
ncbi:MAG: hypothetical protein ACKOGA_09715 [Planctomycetaceae bacterium]